MLAPHKKEAERFSFPLAVGIRKSTPRESIPPRISYLYPIGHHYFNRTRCSLIQSEDGWMRLGLLRNSVSQLRLFAIRNLSSSFFLGNLSDASSISHVKFDSSELPVSVPDISGITRIQVRTSLLSSHIELPHICLELLFGSIGSSALSSCLPLHFSEHLRKLSFVFIKGARSNICRFSSSLGGLYHFIPLSARVISVHSYNDHRCQGDDTSDNIVNVTPHPNWENWGFYVLFSWACIIFLAGYWCINAFVRVPDKRKSVKAYWLAFGIYQIVIAFMTLHAALDVLYFGKVYWEHLL